jgi:hypothetical protein
VSALPTRLLLACCCCALAASLGFAAPTLAQGDAPQVDPQSPAGTEYQLPLDRARASASGSSSTSGAGTGTLFGEGVTTKAKSSGTRAPGRPASGRATQQPATRSDDVAGARGATRAVGASIPGDTGGSLLAIAATAAAVLAAGGLAGLVWRRRSVGR